MGQRTVLIFKSESDSTDVYTEQLQANNFNAIFVPTLCFGYRNLDVLQEKLQQPSNYAGIIFTSPRCVEAVCEAMEGGELPEAWRSLHNYAVGEVTHTFALENPQVQLLTQGKQTGTARALAEFIVDSFDGSHQLPFLLPCSQLATDTLLTRLVANGFKVDACEVYETKCHPDMGETLEQALTAENVQFMAFFSPSGVNCACEYFKTHNIVLDDSKWNLIAIGPSTRRAMEERGLTVYRTCEKPSVEYLIKVLLNPDSDRGPVTSLPSE